MPSASSSIPQEFRYVGRSGSRVCRDPTNILGALSSLSAATRLLGLAQNQPGGNPRAPPPEPHEEK